MVSVVLPHGGLERLPHLAASLAYLRQCRGVSEVIVAEMGPVAVAEDTARRWADRYCFIPNDGPFERARALNAGTDLAEAPLVLWADNDLLLPADFVEVAAAELRQRRLHYLIPYTSVRYLSEEDSREVMRGVRDPGQCEPTNALWSGRAGPGCSGGLGLVSREFVTRFGGLVEGFRGWGAEDNAWNWKAHLLGRMGVTRRDDQHVHHLYHASSGGYAGSRPAEGNPHYQDNVRLLHHVTSMRDARQFLRNFPPPSRGNGHQDAPSAQPTLPVWVYWEGPCPEWVRACQDTISRHAPTLRFLTPETFDTLRDRDRDIDLRALHVAQRADFIRAFLLARYGGLWIDSDCIVMQPLEPVLDLVRAHDFVAHRERSGLVSNGFIGAPPGSRIAAELYERICRTLRSRQPLGWTSLGSEPLTAVLDAAPGGWLELPCQRIQPVCWSQPDTFYSRGDPATHDRAVDGDALCYMMSYTEIRKREARRRESLLDGDTFFTHLVAKALDGQGGMERGEEPYPLIFGEMVRQYRRYGDESLSGPGATLEQTRELRARLPVLLEDLGVRSLIDAPCGDLNWMSELTLGVEEYLGVDVLEELIEMNRWRHGAPWRRFERLDITRQPLPGADAILCRDCLVHLSFRDALRALDNFKRSGSRYLLMTTFTGERPNHDTSGGAWRPLNFERPPFAFPPPRRLLNEQCGEAGGAYSDKCLALWELADLPV